jgi:hypothetical protein
VRLGPTFFPPNRRGVRNPHGRRAIKSRSQPFNPHRCSNQREKERREIETGSPRSSTCCAVRGSVIALRGSASGHEALGVVSGRRGTSWPLEFLAVAINPRRAAPSACVLVAQLLVRNFPSCSASSRLCVERIGAGGGALVCRFIVLRRANQWSSGHPLPVAVGRRETILWPSDLCCAVAIRCAEAFWLLRSWIVGSLANVRDYTSA